MVDFLHGKRWQWLKTHYKSHVLFIFAIITTSCLALIAGLLISSDDNILKYEFFIGIILLGAIVLIYGYVSDILKRLEGFSYEKYVASDIIIKSLTKRVIFDNKSLLEKNKNLVGIGSARTEQIYEIQNNMDEMYPRYLIWIESPSFVPDFDDIYFKKDDEEKYQHLPSESAKFEHIEHHSGPPGSTNRILKRVEDYFYLPVQIESKASRLFSICYRTLAFSKYAFINEKDYLVVRIAQITDKLVIEVCLEETMSSDYEVGPILTPRSDSTNYDFEILNISHVRMRNSEMDLETKPSFSKKKMRWTIYYPKVGYNYKVFFTLKKIQAA